MLSLKIILVFVLLITIINTQYAPPEQPVNTWGEYTMSYQYLLQGDMPVDKINWIGARSSYSYIRQNYTGTKPGNNLLAQNFPLYQQSYYGVRHFEFQMHIVPEFDNQYMVCNGNPLLYEACFGSQSTSEISSLCTGILRIVDLGDINTGCFSFYDRSFEDTMGELETLVNTYDDRFYIVRFSQNYPKSNTTFTNMLNDRIVSRTSPWVYSPSDFISDGLTWPTYNEMLSRGKRLLFYGLNSTTIEHPVPLVFNTISINPYPLNAVTNFGESDCSGVGGTDLSGSSFISFFEDNTKISYSDISFDASNTVGNFGTLEKIHAALKCGFGVTIDNINEDKIANVSWIWDFNEPAGPVSSPPSDLCVTINRKSGRWMTQPCTLIRSFCCKNSDGDFIFSNNTSTGDNVGSVQCPSGYSFLPPVTITEQENLYTLAVGNTANCWINAIEVEYGVKPYEAPSSSNSTSEPIPETVPFDAANGTILKYCNITSEDVNNILNGTGGSVDTLTNCDWEGYVSSVAENSVGFIVFSLVVLGLSVVFWIGICIFFCHTCCNDDDPEIPNKYLHYLLYAVPIVFAIVALILVLIGNARTSEAFGVPVTEIRGVQLEVQIVVDDAKAQQDYLSNFYEEEDIQEIMDSLDTVVSEIDGVVGQVDTTTETANGYRSLGTVIFAFAPVVLLVIGFILYRCGASCLVTTYLIIADVVIIIAVVIMVVHFSLGVVKDDLCVELTRDNGILVILRQAAYAGFQGIDELFNDAIPDIINKACDELIDICNVDGQNCPEIGEEGCKREDVENALETISIYDEEEDTNKNLEECAETCTDEYLKEKSISALEATKALPDFLDLVAKIRAVLNSIISGELIQGFAINFCDAFGNALTFTYLGCAAACIALVTSIVLLIFFMW